MNLWVSDIKSWMNAEEGDLYHEVGGFESHMIMNMASSSLLCVIFVLL